ncbi:uncharacterized protein [Panulirus ornatus]|uniref:uncharacterized protein isoform X2 n=1 Tax=Panulirus ornatus TaxID=150431 RepID=UPI003A8A417A
MMLYFHGFFTLVSLSLELGHIHCVGSQVKKCGDVCGCGVTTGQLRDLRDCVISNAALESLELTTCLKILHLPEPPVVDKSHFSENSLIRLGERKPNLRVVALSGLSGVTDRVIGSLVGGCPQLEELHISSTAITNHALIALANLTQLVSLNIAKTQVSDLGIQQLVGGGVGHSLRELRIDGCARLTDDSIESICHCCSHLSILCFHHCPRLSDRSRELVVEHMARRMKQLTWSAY